MTNIIAPEGAGTFNSGLIDPAWTFASWSQKGEAKSPQRHYDCMTIDQIADLPISEWYSQDCAIGLWVTFPLLEQIFSQRITDNDDGTVTIRPNVYRSWGMKYKGLLNVWRKFNPETGKYAFGGGYGSRKNLEMCILIGRGKATCFDHSIRDFLDNDFPMPLDFLNSPRREHSQKPDEQYEIIERMFDGPYLECFSTTARDNWSRWAPQAHRFHNAT